MSLDAGDARAPTAAPVVGPPTEQPPPAWIGDRLLQLGLITQDQLEVVRIEQRRSGRMLATVLVDLGLVTQDVLASLPAESSGDDQVAPKAALVDQEVLIRFPEAPLVDQEVVIRLPQEAALQPGVVPLASEGSRALEAMRDPCAVARQLPPADLSARQRQALRWASAGLAASAFGCAGWSALALAAALQVSQEVSWLSAQPDRTGQPPAHAEGEAARVSARAEAMRAVLEADRRLEAAGGSPLAALATLRQAMTRDEQLIGLAWQLVGPADGEAAAADAEPAAADEPMMRAADFTLDLTLDLGPALDPAAAVAATERLARRLVEAFPDRPVGIIRQAADILPQPAPVGSAGAPADPDASLTAELHIGARQP